jgi:hypothetical protein
MIIALCSISISIGAEVVALQHDTNNRELIIKCSHWYPENSVYAAVARLQAQDHLLLFPVSELQKGKLAINQDVHKFSYLEAGRMYFPFYII